MGDVGNIKFAKLTSILILFSFHKYTHTFTSCGLQGKLPPGATVVPILFGIDQTHCNLLGRTKMHPLYMSIGNLPNKIRRTYSRNAFQVIGDFPILEGTPKESETVAFRKAKALLYHKCMAWVFRGLIGVGRR